MKRKLNSQRGFGIDVEKRLRELAADGWSAAQIHRELVKEFPENEVPTDRTIRTRIRTLNPQDPSEAWRMAEDRDETAFLLGVLGAVLERSEGRINRLTTREADWIERIKRAVPDIGPGAAFQIARECIRCDESHEDTAHIDAALAFASINARAQGTSAQPDIDRLKARVGTHINLHARQWPHRPLTSWVPGERAAEEYIAQAKDRGGYVLAWDNREGSEFLQIRL